ncbi:MAG: hypothetical protein AAGA75_24510 [Cyanobacteria bacterium P01_E01_bin.6]
MEQQVNLLTRQVNQNAESISRKPDADYMQSGFTEVMEWIAQYETRFHHVESDINELKSGNALIREDIAGLDQRIDVLERGLTQRMDGLDQRMGNVETGLQRILDILEQR